MKKSKLLVLFLLASNAGYICGIGSAENPEDVMKRNSNVASDDEMNVGRHAASQSKDSDNVTHDNPSVGESKEQILAFLNDIMKQNKPVDNLQLDELCLDNYTHKEVISLIDTLKRGRKRYSPHGMLLFGPTGVGKTTLARIIAKEAGYQLIETCASNFVTMYQGSGAGNVKAIFEDAQNSTVPTILFIDEIESIARTDIKPMNSHEYDNAVKTFWTELDRCKKEFPHIFVIVACNDYENLDPRVKRRFIKTTIKVGLPGYKQRKAILAYHVGACEKQMSPWLMTQFGLRTYGWSGSDLQLMVEDAAQKSGDVVELNAERLNYSFKKIKRNKKEGSKKDSIFHFEKSMVKSHVQTLSLGFMTSAAVLVATEIIKSAARAQFSESDPRRLELGPKLGGLGTFLSAGKIFALWLIGKSPQPVVTLPPAPPKGRSGWFW